ncbi:MAG TPA: lysophospholipid acyltransferase family protein [Xanthobacteraceae bacterium]|jgi:1-acyl-sn-glycerol-3-phosphate acyltransferase
MLRTIIALVGWAIATLFGIPAQWIALKLKLPLRRSIPMYYHKLCLVFLGVRVHVRGAPAAERPLMYVSNHCSWIDIPVLSSITPLVFTAKAEIGRWPVVSLLARLQRTVFIDRSRRQATADVNREIASRMIDGDPVVLFGEGTSSDGNTVMPFRTALFGAVRDALGDKGRVYMQPVSVAYTRLHGLPMGRQFRSVAAWYGDIGLTRHFFRVLREGAIDVIVTFGPIISVDADADRKLLARIAEAAVRRMTVAALSGRIEVSGGAVPLPVETR